MTKYLRWVGLAALVAAPVAGIAGTAGTAGATTHAAHAGVVLVKPGHVPGGVPNSTIKKKGSKAYYNPSSLNVVPTWTGTPFSCTTATVDNTITNTKATTAHIWFKTPTFGWELFYTLPGNSTVGICWYEGDAGDSFKLGVNRTATPKDKNKLAIHLT